MAQTAVEWFYQRILAKDIKQVFEQANAMHKEQIEKAFNEGMSNSVDYFGNGVDEAEQYYNETYKK
jgi:hypothetical protein